MSLNFKKSAPAALALAAALSLTGCGKDTSWGAKINGRTLRAGIMIYYQSSAVSEAYSYKTDAETSVLDITIEDMPARDWINAKVVSDMREFAAVESKFDELQLEFSDNEDAKTSVAVDQWWDYLQEYYEKLGISKQSYLDVALNGTKREAIFDYYYGKNGVNAVSDEEIKAYLSESNARIKYIEMPLRDGEGNLLKSAGKTELKTMAEGYIGRAEKGESFEDISDEYDDYYAALQAAAQNTENGVAPQDTNTDAPDPDRDYSIVISKESDTPSAAVREKAFAMSDGEYAVVEEDEVYYIVYKEDLFSDAEYLENNRSTVVHALKDEEFDASVSDWTSAQDVVVNSDAVKRYKLEKHTEE